MTTTDTSELSKFSTLGQEWWQPSGRMKPLHMLQPHRLDYIKEQAAIHFQAHPDHVLQGKRIIDVGCGGGLVCEPLTRLGALVTGLDPEPANITAALEHAALHGLSIDYQAQTIEDYTQSHDEKFDIILSLEVVEHVANLPEYLRLCAHVLKPGGLMILSTLNRTPQSFALAKVGAEYVLRWLPIGTHDWEKFVKPQELQEILEPNGLTIVDTCGLNYNPLMRTWSFSRTHYPVNYFMTATLSN